MSEIHSQIVRAVPGCSFTHFIHEANLAGRAGGVVILPIVRRCRDHISVPVHVHVGRGRPHPCETRCIYSPDLAPLPSELNRGRTGLRAVSPAGVEKTPADRTSTPDDHFTASPHCCVIDSASGRVGSGGGRPIIRAGIVSPAGAKEGEAISSAPDDHFTASPYCRVTVSGCRCIGGAGGRPAICARIVFPALVRAAAITSPPDDHFTASPHCRVSESARRCVGPGGGHPAIRAGIVSPPARQLPGIKSTPDDHFTASPYCRVIGSV